MKYRVKGFKDFNTKHPYYNVINTKLIPRNFETEEMGVEINLTSSKIDHKRQGFREEHTLVTLEQLRVNDIVEAISNVDAVTNIEFSFDRKNLNNYAYYGPLSDTFNSAISNVIKSFPGSLYINHHNVTEESYTYEITVQDFVYDSKSNTATLKIPVYLIQNPFTLYYGQPNIEQKGIQNLVTHYTSFVLTYNDADYPLVDFTGINPSNSNFIYLKVKGNPFTDAGGSNISRTFHIKPNKAVYQGFIARLNSLEKYLLGDVNGAPYKCIFTIPVDNGLDDVSFDEIEFEWPSTDGYNIDVDNGTFNTYVETFNNICTLYDDFKTNKLARMITPASLIDLDQTTGLKMEKLIKSFGNSFDTIKSFMDGLVVVNNQDYDPILGTPKALVKELASNLGWDVFPIVQTTDVVDKTDVVVYNDGTRSYLPSEIDIEVWNRIVNNTSFFMKTKGTRHGIEAILAIVGIPKELISLNEYVYIADAPILSEEGHLVYPTAHEDMHFQMYDEENQKNHYIERYIEQGFKLRRVIDNKKTWTEETSIDNRLIINSKEISLTLDIGQPLENDIFEYHDHITDKDEMLDHHINVGSWKTEVNHALNSYGDLHDQLVAYQQSEPNPITINQILTYAKSVDSYWRNFVDQMIPATAIVTEDGISIKNTLFTSQRFVYQKGISDNSEFVTNNPVIVIPE
jgi:hypothetical protein